MHIRTDYYAGHEQFEITGEKGYIVVTRASDRLLDEPVLIMYVDGEVRAYHNIKSDWGEGFRLSTEHFIRFLLGQEERIVLSAEEGRRILAFSLLILQAAKDGRMVQNGEPLTTS
jgi:predicted dehydrogenase